MNWFQRYGIPGAAFWGYGLLLAVALYDGYWDKNALDIIAPIVIGSFVPIGYVLSIMQQGIYLCGNWGTISQGMREADVVRGKKPEREYNWEVADCVLMTTVYRASKQHGRENGWDKGDFHEHMEALKFINEWTRKRTNVMAINFSLVLAAAVGMLAGAVIPRCCFGWRVDANSGAVWLTVAVVLSSVLACAISYRIMYRQTVGVFRSVYLGIAGKRPCELEIHAGDDMEEGHV